MPLFAYCPHSACAAKIPYEAVKPTTCPKCRKTFASAFTSTPPAVPAPARAAVQDDPDERPLTKSALLAARRAGGALARPRPTPRGEVTHLMNAPAAQAVFPDDGADDEDDTLDPREVRRQARELAATIDTSTIKIADQDEGTFSFKDMWAEGASARESAAKAQVKPKRKARR